MSQSLTVSDFSGGITDNYVNAPNSRAEELDNFVIEYHGRIGKLRSRYGSQILDSANARAATAKVEDLRYFNDCILKTIGNKMYQYVDSDWGWRELVAYGGMPAFSQNSIFPSPSFGEWNGHLLAAAKKERSYPKPALRPIKIFKEDSVDSASVITAGTFAFTYLHPFYNDMIVRCDGSDFTLPTGLTEGDYYRVVSSTKSIIAGTSSFQLRDVSGTLVNITSSPTNIKFSPVTHKVVTAGLPEIAISGIGATLSGAGANTYIYAFVYEYSHNVELTEYLDVGPVSQYKTVASAPNLDLTTTSITLTSIPVLANDADKNTKYELDEIKISVYRTTNAGSTFFKIGEIANGTTSFVDNGLDGGKTDALIQLNQLLYTTGGVLNNDAPPVAELVHVAETDVAYYARTYDGNVFYRSTVYLSVPSDVDSVPEDNYVDVDDEVIGLSSVRSYGIVLCKNSAYRLEGVYDELGRGSIQRIKISDTCSCVSHQSVVQTLEGVFWAGKDAFYYTDGFNVTKVNEDWPNTYALIENRDQIYGKYDSYNNRVAWCVRRIRQDDLVSTENNALFVLHIRSGITSQSAFTTWSNGDIFRPTAIAFSGDEMIRGDTRGYVLKHTVDVGHDAKIDTAVSATLWEKSYIPYSYKGPSMDFGVDIVRKYASSMIVTCKNKTNLSLQLTSNNDDNKRVADIKPIRFRGNLVWGDPTVTWGDESLIWNFDGIIEERRWFPKGSLRFSYKQIQMSPAFVAIMSSDDLELGDVDGTSGTLTLNTLDWPIDLVDYYLAFEEDGFINEFLVTGRTNSVLTFAVGAIPPASATGSKWVLRGYPKGEIVNLLSYTVGYIVFGDTQNSFSKNKTGEVGAGAYGAE